MAIAKFAAPVLFAAAALLTVPAVAQNLIVNGDFETGDLSGWTADEHSYSMFAMTTDWFPAYEGDYSAQIAGLPYDPNVFSQEIHTNAGKLYQLSFFRAQDYWEYSSNSFSLTVYWNDTILFSESKESEGADINGEWARNGFRVFGTGDDVLKFVAANDAAYTRLDNISLTAVPEPASWALMLGGFGLIGGALRQRTKSGVRAEA